MKVKRALIIGSCLLLVAAAGAFASSGMGIGGAFNLEIVGPSGAGATPGLSALFSPPGVPIMIGAGAILGSDQTSVLLTVDWWLYQQPLVWKLGIYIGPGLYLVIADPFQLGVRVPVGFQIFPLEPLEVFLEIAPQLGIGFGDPVTFPEFSLVGALGVRFWF